MKVCHAQELGSYPKVKVTIGSEVNNNSETTESNLMKLHRKIKHNEKVSSAQDLGSYT